MPQEESANPKDQPESATPHGEDPPSETASSKPKFTPPSFLLLGVVSSVSLLADAVTKAWAETSLSKLTLQEPSIVLIKDTLAFQLAYNRGGAFGMLAGEDATWRRPFFLMISLAAVIFIVTLYRRTSNEQWPLKWGLPLVLGGALGNLADRVTKGQVVDFIDYQAGWVESMNELILKLNGNWHITNHWPTFNVADICICIGVGLMAVDMFISKRHPEHPGQQHPDGGTATSGGAGATGTGGASEDSGQDKALSSEGAS